MEKKNKKPIRLIIVTVILLLMVTCSLVYAYFGGFSTGKSANIGEFAKYAETITGDELPEIDVPESTRIVALGEATHGNREFQELKKLVFQDMVENKGIRAFVLEADTGGCEAINRYIHGAEYSDEFRLEDREKILTEVRDLLLENHYQAAAHYADVLIQNSRLFDEYEKNPTASFIFYDIIHVKVNFSSSTFL